MTAVLRIGRPPAPSRLNVPPLALPSHYGALGQRCPGMLAFAGTG